MKKESKKESKKAKDGLPTAEQVLHRHFVPVDPFDNLQILQAMQEYSDQQNAELRERVKALEAQNKRLKIAHYTIVRAYEEYGPLAAVSTKTVSESVLKETGFDPSKETL